MHCEKFEARLQDLLDERLSPECDSALLAHAEQCEPCREMLGLCEQMLGGLDVWEAPTISEGFAARVVAQVQPPVAVATLAPQKQAASPAWKLLAGVLAASVLVGVATVAIYQNRTASRPQPNIAEAPDLPAVAPHAHVAISPAMASPVVDAGPLQAGELAQLVESADGLFDGRTTGRMIREVTSSLPEVPLVDEQIPGLRPITNSFSLTIGIVRKSLPGRRGTSSREEEKPAVPLKPQAEVSRDDIAAGIA